MTNKIAAQTHPEVMTIRDEQETKVRESLLQKDPDFNFEFLRKIVKPILQRLPKGDPYQKANDLIDSSILLYAKGLDTEVMEALTQLKKLLPSLDERVESQLKMEQLAKETIAACAEHQTEIVKNNLVELEREFVNGVGKFLPVYLNSQKRLTLETSSGDQMLQQRQELAKLKQDNERLKREVQTTQDHNRTLEKLVAQSGRGEQDMQVALLEKKLAILEQNQRTKALEINTGLKRR